MEEKTRKKLLKLNRDIKSITNQIEVESLRLKSKQNKLNKLIKERDALFMVPRNG